MTKNKLEEWIKKNIVLRPEKYYNNRIEFFETNKFNLNIINFENVSFSFDDNEIINDVTFGLDMESKITLVGLNGSELINRIESKIWYLDKNKKKIIFNIESYDEYVDLILSFT